MNIKKIKMALTVGLMKNRESANSLQILKEMMNAFQQEVGNFLGLQELGMQNLNASHVQRKYAIQFERVTLDVDLVANSRTNTQIVKSFNLR